MVITLKPKVSRSEHNIRRRAKKVRLDHMSALATGRGQATLQLFAKRD